MRIYYECHPIRDLRVIPAGNIITRACLAPCFFDGMSRYHTIPRRFSHNGIAAPEGGARWTAGYVRLDERKSWERNRSSPPRFAYRTGAWPCEMLRF